jgi:hypothetical protein
MGRGRRICINNETDDDLWRKLFDLIAVKTTWKRRTAHFVKEAGDKFWVEEMIWDNLGEFFLGAKEIGRKE